MTVIEKVATGIEDGVDAVLGGENPGRRLTSLPRDVDRFGHALRTLARRAIGGGLRPAVHLCHRLGAGHLEQTGIVLLRLHQRHRIAHGGADGLRVEPVGGGARRLPAVLGADRHAVLHLGDVLVDRVVGEPCQRRAGLGHQQFDVAHAVPLGFVFGNAQQLTAPLRIERHST
jgi:hypothetical protein